MKIPVTSREHLRCPSVRQKKKGHICTSDANGRWLCLNKPTGERETLKHIPLQKFGLTDTLHTQGEIAGIKQIFYILGKPTLH